MLTGKTCRPNEYRHIDAKAARQLLKIRLVEFSDSDLLGEHRMQLNHRQPGNNLTRIGQIEQRIDLQFSTCNPRTALKSLSLVTTVQLPRTNAIAASCMSTTDMTRPARRSS